MGILDAPPVDANKKPLGIYTPGRDMPGARAHFDASTLTGTNGSNVTRWDASFGAFALNQSSATAPTLLAGAANGKNVLRFGTTGYLKNTDTFGASASVVPSGSGYAPPSLIAAVVRLSTTATTSGDTGIVGAPGHFLAVSVNSLGPYAYAGTPGTLTAPRLNDGQWHVLVAQIGGAGGATIYIDGYLASVSVASVGTQPINSLSVGPGTGPGLTAGTLDVAEVVVGDRLLTPGQIDSLSTYLGAKWGISTIGHQKSGTHLTDAIDSGSQPMRYWMPPKSLMGASTPLVIWCHQLGHTEAMTTGYWSFAMIHAAMQEGWMYAASRAHGDNWGNDASLTDVVNLYNYVNAVQPVSSVILAGASMGGLDAALTVAKGNLPAGKVKGVYLIDPVLDLQWAYTANTNTFQSSINAAYGGVASYAAIPAGHDPIRSFTPSTYSGVRWRFSSSVNDATVSKTANTDAFTTYLAGLPAESGGITHISGHTTSADPADFVAFARRCGL